MTPPEYALLAVAVLSAVLMAKLLLNVAKDIDNFMKEVEDVRTRN